MSLPVPSWADPDHLVPLALDEIVHPGYLDLLEAAANEVGFEKRLSGRIGRGGYPNWEIATREEFYIFHKARQIAMDSLKIPYEMVPWSERRRFHRLGGVMSVV